MRSDRCQSKQNKKFDLKSIFELVDFLRSFLNYAQQFMLIQWDAMAQSNNNNKLNVFRLMCQMFCMTLSVLSSSSSIANQISVIIYFYFIFLSIVYPLLRLLHSSICIKNQWLKSMTSGKTEMIQMVNKKLHHTTLRCWIYFFLPDRMSFGRYNFSSLLFSLFTFRFLYSTSHSCSIYWLAGWLCAHEDVHSSQFTKMERHDVADCCMMVVRCCMSDFCIFCMRVIEQANERASELLYTRASCTFLYPKKCMCACVRRQQNKNNTN